jgi:stress response protein YsnF
MSSSSKKRQTMAKMTRERLVKEKRALKAEKREAKKQAAADAQQAEATGVPIAPETVDDAGLPAA